MFKMSKRLILFVCATLGMATTAQTQTFTLDQYIQRVLDHNKDLKLAQKDKELAFTQKRQAIASALPTVGMESGYTRNLTDYYMYFDMSALNPQATGIAKAPIKRDNELSANVALQQTLFSPQVGSAIKAAKQYQNLTDEVYDASRQAVVIGTKKIFHQALLMQKYYEVAQATENNAKENYEQVKLKFDNGQVSKFELLQAETRWRSTVPQTQQVERNLKLVLNTMKNMAGIPVEEAIELAGSLNEVPPLPEMVGMEQILENRPDYKARLWEEKLRETNVTAAKGSFLPTLTGTVAFAYSAQSNKIEIDEENKLWFAGVKLSLPLFTGGYRPAKIQQAKLELGKTRLNIEKTKEKIENEMTGIELRLKEAHERIVSAETTLNTAKQGFEIAEVTAYNGLATQLQLKDARVGFDQATLNYYAAIYDYLDAYFDWELTTGNVTVESAES